MNRTRILLADHHLMLLDGLVNLLGDEFEVVGVARDGRTMVDLARLHKPDVIVADVSMPQLSGIEAAHILRTESVASRILFLSTDADLGVVQEAFRTGAAGFLLKIGGVDELVKAIMTVSRGGTYITPLLAGDFISSLVKPGAFTERQQYALTMRQREVLQLLAEGNTMKEIGARLKISTRTAESHKYEIMRHLCVKTTAELVRYAVRIKLV
jgi:DNA-binding NarL/FixJ family response regulator